MKKDYKPRTSVKGQGGWSYVSGRDLGREGHGRAYAGASPWARQGIFVQGHPTTATRESGPGLQLERRFKIENPMHKTKHEFIPAPMVCLYCHNLVQGHDALMEKLK